MLVGLKRISTALGLLAATPFMSQAQSLAPRTARPEGRIIARWSRPVEVRIEGGACPRQSAVSEPSPKYGARSGGGQIRGRKKNGAERPRRDKVRMG